MGGKRSDSRLFTFRRFSVVVALVDMTEEEPLYLYVPESGEQLNNSKSSRALFTQSLLLLNDGLASGTLLTQYEQMYRKNPDLAITEARKGANATKNRYRDISPCECLV